jgi:hypothetical protein
VKILSEENNQGQDDKRRFIQMDFASMAKLILKDLSQTNEKLKFFNKYKKEDVISYLNNPQKNEKQLREISQFIYNASPHYRRLINYFAKMPLFYYNVIPYGLTPEKVNQKTFYSNFLKTLDLLENMNIRHEFSKVLTIAFREDVFYGYEYSNDTSYFIQKLDADYCRISSIEDGVYNFQFDFSFFDSNKEKLELYAPEFKSLYSQYQKDRNKKWLELNSEKTICIKINEDLEYCIPPFAGVFEYLFDIEDYKSLQKARTEIDNYKLLVMNVPLRPDSDTNNDFLIELDAMQYFYNLTAQALPEGVGLAMSPTKMDSFTFNKDATYKNNVEEAIKAYWNGAGVPDVLFGSGANSGAIANLSIKTDEEIIFAVLRQMERWLNRKLKFNKGTYKFKVSILNITVFNYKDVQTSLLTASQYGVPVKMDLAISYGLTPSDVINKSFLEEDILGITDKWKPLQSSHTQSESNGGAPNKGTNTEKVTETGQVNDGNNSNNRA